MVNDGVIDHFCKVLALRLICTPKLSCPQADLDQTLILMTNMIILKMMTLVLHDIKHGGQAMPYMVTLIIIEALINWLGRGQRSVTAYTCLL